VDCFLLAHPVLTDVSTATATMFGHCLTGQYFRRSLQVMPGLHSPTGLPKLVGCFTALSAQIGYTML